MYCATARPACCSSASSTPGNCRRAASAGLPCIALPLAPAVGCETWDAIVARTPPPQGRSQRAAGDLAMLLYTSGSTGQPKGVMQNFGSITAATNGILANTLEHDGGVPQDSRVLSYLPLAHCFERAWVECPAFVSGRVHVYFTESYGHRPHLPCGKSQRTWCTLRRTLWPMLPRFHTDTALQAGGEFTLPAGAARHVQVLRLQPGTPITLFDGRGGEWWASVVYMGRAEVRVRVDRFDAVERELPLKVTLAVGMPANERMDALVEKATELGAAAIQPLLCERSVLRLSGERALKKVVHWQAVAVAACEQSGRTRVPRVAPVRPLLEWLAGLPPANAAPHCERLVLSLRATHRTGPPLAQRSELLCLSGPEGGFTATEEQAAAQQGFLPLRLGARTLRADTAPLALLAHIALSAQPESPE